MQKISVREINEIQELRRIGHSLPEIKRTVGRGSGTIFRYARSIPVDSEFVEILRSKQGGSRMRSKLEWDKAKAKSSRLIGKLTSRDKILILAALYWGEGTKRELNIINGDATLLRVFVSCLTELDISKKDLRISLRLFEDINEHKAKVFWAQELDVSRRAIYVSEFLKGKKEGKFPFGMCRIRLRRSGSYFKLIISMIESIKSELSPRSSMDRTAAS